MEVFNLNIIPGAVAPVIHASQYDEAREFRANLFEGAEIFELSGDEIISLNVRKPDGNVVTAAVANTGAAYVEFSTTLQMTACAGASLCQLRIENSPRKIGSLNFILAVERDPLEGGIQSESAIHDLQAQIAEAVADQYDADAVIFDTEPTADHGIGYTVTSEGLKNYIPKNVGDLGGVIITAPAQGEALVFDENGNLVNGTVSTVGNLDDLNDVDTTGKASGDSLRYDGNEWVAKPTTIALTQAEYDALQTKEPNTHYVITDAPNLNPTASDIEYSSGVSVKQAIDGIVESGSNANGNYIKYAEGSMICTKTASVEVLNNAWSDWGALKEVTNLSLGDFAETFYQAPNVSLSLSGDAAWLERISATTVSSVGTISILRPNSPGRTTNYSVSVTAIGRWKA